MKPEMDISEETKSFLVDVGPNMFSAVCHGLQENGYSVYCNECEPFTLLVEKDGKQVLFELTPLLMEMATQEGVFDERLYDFVFFLKKFQRHTGRRLRALSCIFKASNLEEMKEMLSSTTCADGDGGVQIVEKGGVGIDGPWILR